MFHLVAYTIPALTTAVDTDATAIQDNILYIQNNHIVPQVAVELRAAYAVSPTLLRAKVSSPKIRQTNTLYVRPVDFGGVVPSANPNIDIKTYSPFKLQMLEEIQVLATANPGTTERFLSLLWLMQNFEPAPLGDVFTFRWTSAVADVAYTWSTLGVPLFEQVPPLGTYVVIDSEWYATNAIAHRLTFDNQYLRPGTLGFANNHSRYPYRFQFSALGRMGLFTNTNLPRVEALSSVADSTHEGYMHAVKTG